MAKHNNSGSCDKCLEIFSRYPVCPLIKKWFSYTQSLVPDAHISCAGRGQVEQETEFQRKSSNAHWKQSAHNWGAAVDIFQLTSDGKLSYDKDWFNKKIATSVEYFNKLNQSCSLNWYGAPGSAFYELPHVEIKDWQKFKEKLGLKLVE